MPPMERSPLGLLVGLVILLGTVSAVTLFLAGRTPPGTPVVPSSEATLASDQVAVARMDFRDAIASSAADDRRVRLLTRIAAGYRLVDIGLARVAVRAPVDRVVAWDRQRRSGEPVIEEVPLGPSAGRVPIGRDGDGPLDVRLLPVREGEGDWEGAIGPARVRLTGDRLRVEGQPVPVEVPVTGPGAWIVFLDAEGRLQRLERAGG
jgi:hypothetical protein